MSITDDPPFQVMPADVFVGGCGHIVICQEWPCITQGESYVRVMINPADAELVCKQIMAAAGEARK